MTKVEQTDIAKEIMNSLVHVNTSFCIVKQYNQLLKNYEHEIELSPCFYSTIFNSLVETIMMGLGRIYDRHKDSQGISKVMNRFEGSLENLEVDLSQTITRKLSNKAEQKFFQKLPQYSALLSPHHCEITINEYLNFFSWQLAEYDDLIKNLLKQRNGFYAHHDKKYLLNNSQELFERYGLSYEDVQKLIDFAIEFFRVVLALLTDVWVADLPINAHDWIHTLERVKITMTLKE